MPVVKNAHNPYDPNLFKAVRGPAVKKVLKPFDSELVKAVIIDPETISMFKELDSQYNNVINASKKMNSYIPIIKKNLDNINATINALKSRSFKLRNSYTRNPDPNALRVLDMHLPSYIDKYSKMKKLYDSMIQPINNLSNQTKYGGKKRNYKKTRKV